MSGGTKQASRLEFGARRNRLEQLRTFREVVRRESYAGAAESFDLLPATTARQVHALEEDLQTRLFARNGSRLALTADGKNLHEVVSHLLDKLDQAADTFARPDADSEVSGRVRIATGRAAMSRILPRLVHRSRERYPQVVFELKTADVDDALRRLRNQEVDLVFGTDVRVAQDIARHPVLSYDFVLAAPPGRPAPQEIEDARSAFTFPLVAPPSGTGDWEKIERISRRLDARVEVAMRIAGWEAIKRYVEIGIGHAFLPDFCLGPDEKVSVTRLPSPFCGLHWCLYRHANTSSLSEAGRRFVRDVETNALRSPRRK